MTWSRGADAIRRLLEHRELEEVPYDQALVDSLLADAETHLGSVTLIAPSDSTGAYELAYEAMRKTATALLVAQGLRPTSRGGHIAVRDAMEAQFGGGQDPPFSSFDQLRRQRNDLEYPDDAGPGVDEDDVEFALEEAKRAFEGAHQLLHSGALGLFR